jgi:DNA (cytosine-5)-methyltransferase 1
MENVPLAGRHPLMRAVEERFCQNGYGISSMLLNASFYGVPQARKRYFLVGRRGGPNNGELAFFMLDSAEQPLTVREHFKSIGLDCGKDHYYRHPRNCQRRGIFSMDEPCPTIRGQDRRMPKHYAGHPGDSAKPGRRIKNLTLTERAAIQTFPLSFKFEGIKSHLNQMIGNAVPVKLAEHVARVIMLWEKTLERRL